MAAAAEKKLPSGPQMAVAVLEAAERPVHVKLIAARVLEEDRKRKPAQRAYKGKTPEQTISAALTVSSNGSGPFVKTAPGVFALRDWPASKRNKRAELPEKTAAPASNGGSSSGSSSGRKRSGSSSGKGSGQASPPRKRGRKSEAEKRAVLAEAEKKEQPAEAEAPAAA